MKTEYGFIPWPECTVMSGDCFYYSKCLGSCRPRARKDHEKRIIKLEQQMKEVLEKLINGGK